MKSRRRRGRCQPLPVLHLLRIHFHTLHFPLQLPSQRRHAGGTRGERAPLHSSLAAMLETLLASHATLVCETCGRGCAPDLAERGNKENELSRINLFAVCIVCLPDKGWQQCGCRNSSVHVRSGWLDTESGRMSVCRVRQCLDTVLVCVFIIIILLLLFVLFLFFHVRLGAANDALGSGSLPATQLSIRKKRRLRINHKQKHSPLQQQLSPAKQVKYALWDLSVHAASTSSPPGSLKTTGNNHFAFFSLCLFFSSLVLFFFSPSRHSCLVDPDPKNISLSSLYTVSPTNVCLIHICPTGTVFHHVILCCCFVALHLFCLMPRYRGLHVKLADNFFFPRHCLLGSSIFCAFLYFAPFVTRELC
ncbi:hypothetical protein BC830DRAFT_53298 [Chytriomyces sp. MP71]|nr:hypothetical protein BC830DRAFT_53298 [Chytriomyces sp. MP71]